MSFVEESVATGAGGEGKQRFYINVPNPLIDFCLGAERNVTDDQGNTSQFGYKGFSVKTNWHCFIDIRNATVIQGGQTINLQGAADFLQYFDGSSVLSAGKHTNLQTAEKLSVVAGSAQRYSQIPPYGGGMPKQNRFNKLETWHQVRVQQADLKKFFATATTDGFSKTYTDTFEALALAATEDAADLRGTKTAADTALKVALGLGGGPNDTAYVPFTSFNPYSGPPWLQKANQLADIFARSMFLISDNAVVNSCMSAVQAVEKATSAYQKAEGTVTSVTGKKMDGQPWADEFNNVCKARFDGIGKEFSGENTFGGEGGAINRKAYVKSAESGPYDCSGLADDATLTFSVEGTSGTTSEWSAFVSAELKPAIATSEDIDETALHDTERVSINSTACVLDLSSAKTVAQIVSELSSQLTGVTVEKVDTSPGRGKVKITTDATGDSAEIVIAAHSADTNGESLARLCFTEGTERGSEVTASSVTASEMARFIRTASAPANKSSITDDGGAVKIESDKEGPGSHVHEISGPVADLIGLSGKEDEVKGSYKSEGYSKFSQGLSQTKYVAQEIQEIPNDVRHLMRPLQNSVDNAVGACGAAVGAVQSVVGVASAWLEPQDPPPSQVGIFGPRGITLATEDRLVANAPMGYTFVTSGQRVEDSDWKSEWPLGYSTMLKAEKKFRAPKGWNEVHNRPIGFKVRSGTDLDLASTGLASMAALGKQGYARVVSNNVAELVAGNRVMIAARGNASGVTSPKAEIEILGKKVVIGAAKSGDLVKADIGWSETKFQRLKTPDPSGTASDTVEKFKRLYDPDSAPDSADSYAEVETNLVDDQKGVHKVQQVTEKVAVAATNIVSVEVGKYCLVVDKDNGIRIFNRAQEGAANSPGNASWAPPEAETADLPSIVLNDNSLLLSAKGDSDGAGKVFLKLDASGKKATLSVDGAVFEVTSSMASYKAKGGTALEMRKASLWIGSMLIGEKTGKFVNKNIKSS